MSREISLQEAMKLAGVTQKTIWTWCRKNNFTWRRAVNKRLWIEEKSFLSFVKSKEKEYNLLTALTALT